MKGKSYHHLNGYAVQDRIDTSGYSDRAPPFTIADPSVMLPAQTEIDLLRKELAVLVER